MSKVKVISPGPLTTIQDSGRYAHQQSGMSVSGVMDSYSHRAANILVGNAQQEAVLEATLLGPTLEFLGESVIAVTGGATQPQINGESAPMWQALRVKAGDKLSFQPLQTGCRLYIAFAGGIDVPEVMGSKSTYVKAGVGGLDGRSLKRDDEFALNSSAASLANVKICKAPSAFVPQYGGEITLRVVLGPQDEAFTDEGIKTFLNHTYTITSESDRMGYRLEGPEIAHKDGGDIISDGIVMGAIQVPGSGKPIILMSDRQTTGGYTKIAGVISADLPKVGQARPGTAVKFQQVSIEEAQQILLDFDKQLDELTAALQPVKVVAPLTSPALATGPIPPAPAKGVAPWQVFMPALSGEQTYQVTINGENFNVTVKAHPDK